MSYHNTQSHSRPRPYNKDNKREIVEVDRPVSITLQSLLESGSHFGTNSTSRHPRMTQYIYGIRNNIYIINLEKTLECWDLARDFIVKTTSQGGDILFVGTKRQVKDLLKIEAAGCGAHFVSEKWLGGTLTNLEVIRKTINRIDKLEALLTKAENSETPILTKKEKLDILREVDKLNSRLGGLRDMKKLPSLIFITDPVKDHLAVEEAKRMNIPIVAIADTDANPDLITYPIPANDDGASALTLFVRAVADSVKEGKALWEEKLKERGLDEPTVEELKFSEDVSPVNPRDDRKRNFKPNVKVPVSHKKKVDRAVVVVQQGR